MVGKGAPTYSKMKIETVFLCPCFRICLPPPIVLRIVVLVNMCVRKVQSFLCVVYAVQLTLSGQQSFTLRTTSAPMWAVLQALIVHGLSTVDSTCRNRCLTARQGP